MGTFARKREWSNADLTFALVYNDCIVGFVSC